MMDLEVLKTLVRDVPDFPKPGIVFKDITPVLGNREAFHSLIHSMSELVPPGTQTLVAIESRGFILGSAIAYARGLGLVIVRKPGKLPFKTHSQAYDLEYGQDALQIHVDALKAGDQICVIDDVLATGGTAAAVEALCTKIGARVLNHVFMMELEFLKGRSRLKAPARSLIAL